MVSAGISVMVSAGISSTGSRSRSRFRVGDVRISPMMFMPSKSTSLVLPLRSLKSYDVGKSVGVASAGLLSVTNDTVRGLGDRCSTGL